MSYTLTAYLMDLEELRRAVASRDEALIQSVIEANPEHFQDDPDVDAEEGEISLRRALTDLVMGNAPAPGSAHQYGYALEQLCRHLGEEVLGRDMWCDIRWTVLEATGMSDLLDKSGPPVPLPANNDFPAIGHLKAQEIAAILSRMGDGHLQTAAPSGRKPRRSFRSWLLGPLMSRITRREPMTAEDIRELLQEYEAWLREAAESGRGLVFFYY